MWATTGLIFTASRLPGFLPGAALRAPADDDPVEQTDPADRFSDSIRLCNPARLRFLIKISPRSEL